MKNLIEKQNSRMSFLGKEEESKIGVIITGIALMALIWVASFVI